MSSESAESDVEVPEENVASPDPGNFSEGNEIASPTKEYEGHEDDIEHGTGNSEPGASDAEQQDSPRFQQRTEGDEADINAHSEGDYNFQPSEEGPSEVHSDEDSDKLHQYSDHDEDHVSHGQRLQEDEEEEEEESHNLAKVSRQMSEASDSGIKPSQSDLFGEDISDSSDDEGPNQSSEKPTASASMKHEDEEEPRGHFPGESEEETEEPEAEQETVITAEIPRITMDLGKTLHFVKFPNFLSVEPRPFDPEIYEDEIEDDEILDEEGRSRLKLKCENTIRWRNVVDSEGNTARQSNAKIVRWSDGSMSLYLGAEIFDIHVHPLQDHNHMFVRQGTGLQGQSVFRTKLSFRPYSTESFTHRKLTLSMADKSNKAQKVKVLVSVGKDPEAQKHELLKKEEERIRATQRRETQQRRIREKLAGRNLSSHYLEDREEESEDENSVSISAIKRGYKERPKELKGSHIYSSDSEAESADTAGGIRGKATLESDDETAADAPKKKARVIEESDEDE